MFSLKLQSAPGSVGQVRQAATDLLFTAKGRNLPTILVGHVTKDGSLAGPKVLEHVVDTVLYFEGQQHHSHRVVRAVKNRFGAVSELGVFEMTGAGLRPVPNPSKLFLAERPDERAGLGRAVHDRRLAADPRRGAGARERDRRSATRAGRPAGSIHNRLSLLLAVLDKRAGLNLATDDVFVNVAGGLDDRRAGGRSGDCRRGRVEPSQSPDSARRRRVRRDRPGRRGARDRARRAPRARSRAARLHAGASMPTTVWRRRDVAGQARRSSASARSEKRSTP